MNDLMAVRGLFDCALKYSIEAYALIDETKKFYICLLVCPETFKAAVYTCELSILKIYDSRQFTINDMHTGVISHWLEDVIDRIMIDKFGARVNSVLLFADTPCDMVKPKLKIV